MVELIENGINAVIHLRLQVANNIVDGLYDLTVRFHGLLHDGLNAVVEIRDAVHELVDVALDAQ